MADDGQVKIKIDGDSSGFEKTLKAAAQNAEKEVKTAAQTTEKEVTEAAQNVESEISNSSESASKSLETTNTAASNLASKGLALVTKAAAAVATAIGTAATAAVVAGSKYESAFAQVETIMDASEVSYQEMSASIMDLSDSTGQSATDLSESVYNAISATGDTANAVSLVASASKLATAGFTDSASALSTLTTITNAYGIATTEATAISDSLVMTQNLGVTTVSDLSSAMGRAIATAAAYSIDLYNLESAYVSLTKGGISTEESTTYLSSMFKELGDSGSDVAEIIQNETGMSFGQLMDAGYSLGDVLKILIDDVDGDTEALMNLWSSAEAGKAASAIASQGIDSFNSNLSQLQNSAGATETAYQTMTETLSYQVDLLKTRVTNFGTAIYERFSGSLTDSVGSLADAFSDLTESVNDGELADSVDNLASSLANLAESASETLQDALPGLINGASWMISNLPQVATGIMGVVAAYGAYKVAAYLATTSTEEMMAAFAMNPIGLIAAGAVAGATALGLLLGAIADTNGPASEFNITSQEISDDMANMAQEIRDAVDAYNEFKTGTDENQASAASLITELNGMVAAYDGSASAAEAIEQVVSQLNDLIPGLNLSWDEQSNTLSETAEAMSALNDEYATQQTYDQSMATETELEQKRNEAIAEQATALENLNEAKEYYNSLDEYASYAEWDAAAEAVKTAQDAYDSATQTVQDATIAFNNQQMETNAAADAYDDAADAAGEYADSADDATAASDDAADAASKMSDEMQAAHDAIYSVGESIIEATSAEHQMTVTGDELLDEYDDLKKEFDDNAEACDEATRAYVESQLEQLELLASTKKLEEELPLMSAEASAAAAALLVGSKTSIDEWVGWYEDAFDSIVNGFEAMELDPDNTLSTWTESITANTNLTSSWNATMQELVDWANTTGGPAAQEAVSTMLEGGAETYGTAANELLSAVKDSTNNAENELVSGINAAGDAAMESAKVKFMAANNLTTEQFNNLVSDGIVTQLADGTVQIEDQAAAAAAGVTTAIEGETTEAESAATTLVESIAGAALDADTQTAFQNAGKALGQYLSTGLSESGDTISASAKTVVNQARSKARSAASGFSTVGYYIASGIASGIRSGNSMVTAAAVAVVKNAKNSANSYAQTASPSRLFANEVGYYLSAGIAKGIDKGNSEVQSAAVSVIYDATMAARAATVPSVTTIGGGSTNTTVNNIYNSGTGSGSATTIEVPVVIDGKEIARASTTAIFDQYSFMH